MKREVYKYLPVICLIIFTSTLTFAQESTVKFLYKKDRVNDEAGYLLMGPDTVEIPKPELTQFKTYEQKITSTHGKYVFVVDRKQKTSTLYAHDKRLLGSYSKKGKNEFDITMADGTVYDFNKEGSSKWKYSVNKKDVFKLSFVKEDGKKYIQYEILDPAEANLSSAILISQIMGVSYIQYKSTQPIYLGASAALIVIMAATASNPTPSVQ